MDNLQYTQSEQEFSHANGETSNKVSGHRSSNLTALAPNNNAQQIQNIANAGSGFIRPNQLTWPGETAESAPVLEAKQMSDKNLTIADNKAADGQVIANPQLTDAGLAAGANQKYTTAQKPADEQGFRKIVEEQGQKNKEQDPAKGDELQQETTQTKTEENETLPPPQVTWKKGIMSSFYIGGKKGEADFNTAQKDIWSLIPPKRRKTRESGQFIAGDIIIEFENVKLEEHPNLSLQRVVCYFVEEGDIAKLLEQRPIPGQHSDITPTKLFMKEAAGLKKGEKINREKAKDTGVELLLNLCASKEGYLYQVANAASELPMRAANGKIQKQDEKVPLKTLPYLDQSGENGIKNLSTTPRDEKNNKQWKNKENVRDADDKIPFANGETVPVQYFDGSAKRKKDENGKELPFTSFFDGITTVSKDVKWYQGEEEQARSTVVFHELWENYERTTNLEPYQYSKMDSKGEAIDDASNPKEYIRHEDPNKKGAHDKAVDAESNFYAKSKTPGAFTKAINIKTQEKIK